MSTVLTLEQLQQLLRALATPAIAETVAMLPVEVRRQYASLMAAIVAYRDRKVAA